MRKAGKDEDARLAASFEITQQGQLEREKPESSL
jgi:hypothetical protein